MQLYHMKLHADVSNNEQFKISTRWVNDEYTMSEEPIGLVQLPDTFANTLVAVIKHMLRPLEIYAFHAKFREL